ncbi:MAG TPA: hypothetical protein VEB21_11610 [Terriglobales bacterium]|nr:hypothetical protein [Terriglobales bacterium]
MIATIMAVGILAGRMTTMATIIAGMGTTVGMVTMIGTTTTVGVTGGIDRYLAGA